MKKLKGIAFGVLLSACFFHAGAQEQKIPLNEPDNNKPLLFADLPQKMNLKLTNMESLLDKTIGTAVSIQASDDFLFEGTVVSTSDRQEASVRTVVIRSSNRPGALLSFTRTTGASGRVSYVGRIVSRNNGDAYEITEEKGQYVLQKKNLYDLMSE